MSVEPPGGKGTIQRIGFAGQDCACTVAQSAVATAATRKRSSGDVVTIEPSLARGPDYGAAASVAAYCVTRGDETPYCPESLPASASASACDGRLAMRTS
jgi:hypothetical protein